MASNRIKGLTIDIGGDTTKLSESLKDVDKSLRNTQNQLRDVNKLLKLDPKNTDLLKQKQELLGKQVEDTKSRLDELKKAQEQMDANGVDRNSEQYKALQREIVETENKLKSAQDAAKDFGNVMSQQLKAVGGQLQETGQKLQDFGGEMTKKVSAPIAAVGAASVAAWSQIDEGLDIVVQKTGATGEALDDLQGSVKNIAKTIPTSFETAGTAVGEINTRFGLTGDALEDLSAKFIKFADINGVDLTSSIDKVQKVSSAYNLTTEETALLLDKMNAVGQATGVSIDSLESSMVSNASVMKQMGLDAFGSAEFLGQLEVSSIDSNSALTGLKKALQNATKEGKPMSAALEEVQKSMTEAKTEQEGLQSAIDLFGSKAGPAIYDACKNGSLSFETLASSAEDSAGSVEGTYEGMQDATDRLQTVWNQLMELGYELAEAMMPLIDEAIDTLTPLLEKVSEWLTNLSDGQMDMIVKIGLVVAAIGPAISAVGTVISVLGTVTSVIGGVVGVLGGPLTLAIGAAIAIGVLLWKNWDTVKEKAEALLTKIKDVFDGIKNTITDKIESAKDKVRDCIDAIKGFFNFEFKWPHIPLPHFSISGSANPLKWLEEGVPKIAVDWYAKAEDTPYLFNSPQIIGVGDVPEVVIGKQAFDRMTSGTTYNINMTVNAAPGQSPEAIAKAVSAKIQREITQKKAVYGV